MYRSFIATTVVATFIVSACSSQKPVAALDVQAYQVASGSELQQRFQALNQQLALDFKAFKQQENIAFSDQSALDANNLHTLKLHLVSRNALKQTKVGYCQMMNAYFQHMYRLGHYNQNFLSHLTLQNVTPVQTQQAFVAPDAFYDFILNRYSSYHQVQEAMRYSCNLKTALV